MQEKMQGPNLPLFFADPELMENAQASKDTTTKPTTIAALNGVSRGVDFSLGLQRKVKQVSCCQTHTWGKDLVSSVDKRSAKPAKRVPPPVKTTFPMRTWRNSGSQARKASVIRAGIFFGKFGFVACIQTNQSCKRQTK